MPHPSSPAGSTYIHVPFCRHRCGYCDFTLIAGRDDLVPRYLWGLEREMELREFSPAQPSPVETLFFGGGTPTHPSTPEMRRLFEIVLTRFPLTPTAEFSVEANPLDLTDEKIAVLGEAGVNRVSLGVQSFQTSELQILERDHQATDVRRIVEQLRTAIPHFSLDLMFAVPGQTLADWHANLQAALELSPPHLSTYGLTWEANTAFSTRLKRGELQPADNGLEREMYASTIEILTQAGYVHYETSNFARPGYECRHHLVYWNGGDYEAFGPGAARHQNGHRETNVRSVLGWLQKLENGQSVVADAEDLSPETRARELIMLRLRLHDGIDRTAFREQTGFSFDQLAGPALQENVSAGLLADDGQRVVLTAEGKLLADRVTVDFL